MTASGSPTASDAANSDERISPARNSKRTVEPGGALCAENPSSMRLTLKSSPPCAR